MAKHVPHCRACLNGKPCSEAERIIGNYDGHRLMEAVSIALESATVYTTEELTTRREKQAARMREYRRTHPPTEHDREYIRKYMRRYRNGGAQFLPQQMKGQ